jgi:PAS domain S-box-containing protein
VEVAAIPTIVVIDDSAEVRALIRTQLRLSGRLDVVADGANGFEAIGLAYQHQPSLLLLDMSMPSMDGLDALPGILEVSPRTQVVVYTGFEERRLATTARDLGAAAYIEKSMPVEQLADELVDILAHAYSETSATRAASHQRRMAVVRDGGRSHVDPTDEGDHQRTLVEHLESFREVFDEAAIGMATLTLTGTVVRANRSLGELMLCDPGDLVGVDYGRLTSGRGDLLDSALAEISQGFAELVQLEHDVAGWPEQRRALATLAAVRDSSGQALYVFLQVQDITAQSEAEKQIRRSEERFRLLVEAVQEYAIFMLDRDGRVTSWNAGAQRIKGYTASDIIGQHFRIFYPPETQASGHPEYELAEALREGRYEEEGWRVRKDGTHFWANVLITAVFDEEGRHLGFAKVTRDTTEHRQADQERIEAATALETANRELATLNVRLQHAAEDKARFLAVTAHELRSPLTVLGGSADTLVRHWHELADDERQLLLEGMTSSSARLRRLLGDLLTASKLDTGSVAIEARRIPLSSVLRSVVDIARAGGAEGAVIVEGRRDVEAFADPDRLGQALENLVRNGLYHGVPPVRVLVDVDESTIRIRVTDSGHGVDPAIQPRLFERFATGDHVEGSGLGLFIARELARAQGGDVSYEQGSDEHPAGAFVLTAPLAQV